MATWNDKDRRTYQNICHLTERGVLSLVQDLLVSKYGREKVTATPAFVYALGDIPVALVAHADTVFKLPPTIENFYYDPEKDVVWNPEGAGADDRAGIFAIVTLLKRFNLKPHVIVTTGEESGCIGAGKLIAAMPKYPTDLKFMIQLDRRNRNDSVYYDCDNKDFENFINQFGFKTEWGTFTDISVLAPVWGFAAVNLSVGYQDEHHEIERLHVDWLYETIDKVAQILWYVEKHKDMEAFKYIPGYDYFTNHYLMYGDSWYEDEGAWYTKHFLPKPGYDHCDWCHKEVPSTQTIPVKMEHGKTELTMCLDCHDKVAHQVVWCRKCGTGYFINQYRIKDIDIKNYICEDCQNELQLRGNSETVQSSASSVAGFTGDTPYDEVVSNLGVSKVVVSPECRKINL